MVAVWPMAGSGTDANANAILAIEGQFQGELAARSGLAVLERTQVQSVLQEQALQQSGLVDADTAVRVGRLLHADVVLLGACRAIGEQIVFDARAVRTATGQVAWADECQGSLEQVTAEAATLADACAVAVQGPAAHLALAATSLQALKHQDRAATLRGQHLLEDAASEDLLALRQDPGLANGAEALAQDLKDAGFPQLAAAEAADALAAAKTPAADSPLHALAAYQMPPTPAPQPAPPSEAVRGALAIIATLEPLKENDPQAERDLIHQWYVLTRLEAEDGHDQAALKAYQHAEELSRDRRRRDARTLLDEVGAVDARDFDPNGLPPGPRLMRLLLQCRELDIPADLPAAVAAALKAGIKNDDLALPLVLTADLPITDRVGLKAIETTLLHLPLGQLPKGAAIVTAALSCNGELIRDRAQYAELAQRWVASEADQDHASAGVAWIAKDMRSSNPDWTRRPPLRRDFATMDEAVRWEVDHPDQARGIAWREMAPADLKLHMQVVLPPGSDGQGFHADGCQELWTAIGDLLDGRAAQAKVELAQASGHKQYAHAIPQLQALIALAGGAR